MTDQDAEFCGFLDVKYLGDKCKSQRARKRTLTPWKVWKRHWCSAKKLGPGLGIRIQLDCGISSNSSGNSHCAPLRDKNKSVIIPPDASISRARSRSKHFAFGIFPPNERKPLLYLAGTSETESQRWMGNIRHLLRPRRHRFPHGAYSISMVDNVHSRGSGLSGLYGDLVASATGVFVKDVHTGEIKENFEWKEFDQFHLISAGRPEDVKCICVIHTTKEFRGGVGELHVFCTDAGRLLRELATRGRGSKDKHVFHRPLSFSESDLRITGAHPTDDSRESLTPPGCPPTNPLKPDSNQFFHCSDSWLQQKTPEADVSCETQNAHNACVENVYQPEPASVPNVSNVPRERTSAVSTSSGIYEEISEDSDDPELYNRVVQEEPPPLPPRRKLGALTTSSLSENSEHQSEAMPPPGGDNPSTTILDQRTEASVDETDLDTCIYVPMSPRLKDITLQQLQSHSSLQENDYVIMR